MYVFCILYSYIYFIHLYIVDSKVMSKSGHILITEDLGSEYGFVDVDG